VDLLISSGFPSPPAAAALGAWTFTPYTGALSGSNYSPVFYSPTSPAPGAPSTTADYSHYKALLKSALQRYNQGKAPGNRVHLHHSGGRFSVSIGGFPQVVIDGVNSALDFSNIYHCFKLFDPNIVGFINYLRENGVPTIVQAVHTGARLHMTPMVSPWRDLCRQRKVAHCRALVSFKIIINSFSEKTCWCALFLFSLVMIDIQKTSPSA